MRAWIFVVGNFLAWNRVELGVGREELKEAPVRTPFVTDGDWLLRGYSNDVSRTATVKTKYLLYSPLSFAGLQTSSVYLHGFRIEIFGLKLVDQIREVWMSKAEGMSAVLGFMSLTQGSVDMDGQVHQSIDEGMQIASS